MHRNPKRRCGCYRMRLFIYRISNFTCRPEQLPLYYACSYTRRRRNLKILIHTGHPLLHPEVEIRCREKDREVDAIVSALTAHDKIPAKMGEETVLLTPSQILYFEAVDRRTFAYLDHRVAEVTLRLYELTAGGLFYGYVRVSKSIVINVIHVKNVVRLLSGNLDLTMDNGEHVIVSRRFVKEFHSFINMPNGRRRNNGE